MDENPFSSVIDNLFCSIQQGGANFAPPCCVIANIMWAWSFDILAV
jgi:hypothetical protein